MDFFPSFPIKSPMSPIHELTSARHAPGRPPGGRGSPHGSARSRAAVPTAGAIRIPTVPGYTALKLVAWLDRSEVGGDENAPDCGRSRSSPRAPARLGSESTVTQHSSTSIAAQIWFRFPFGSTSSTPTTTSRIATEHTQSTGDRTPSSNDKSDGRDEHFTARTAATGRIDLYATDRPPDGNPDRRTRESGRTRQGGTSTTATPTYLSSLPTTRQPEIGDGPSPFLMQTITQVLPATPTP